MNGKLTPVLISGVSCYEQDGTAYLKLEDVARGLGFITIAASGNEVVRWSTVHKYLTELGVATSCNGSDYRSKCPDYIPENIFYRLAMKAKNETAEKFQALVADEIIPSIRKTGAYESFQAQQHIEQLEATNTRLNAAIQAVSGAKQQLADVISLRNDFIKHRDNYKARYMQAKTNYGKICDSLRQAESLVQKAQAELDSRIDQLSIIAFGLPGFDEIMKAVIGTLPAKKEK